MKAGDLIKLSVSQKRIELLVSDDELERRRAEWVQTTRPLESLRGYDKLYASEVTQADEGCDFEFLKPV